MIIANEITSAVLENVRKTASRFRHGGHHLGTLQSERSALPITLGATHNMRATAAEGACQVAMADHGSRHMGNKKGATSPFFVRASAIASVESGYLGSGTRSGGNNCLADVKFGEVFLKQRGQFLGLGVIGFLALPARHGIDVLGIDTWHAHREV